MADTIISTDGLTSLANQVQDAKYETTVQDFQNKEFLSNKLTQLNDANEARADHTNDKLTQLNDANEARANYTNSKVSALNDFGVQRAEYTNDKISNIDWKNEARATRGVDELLAESRFLDIGAAKRDDASKLAASNNAFAAAAQADRVAQAATAQVTAVAAATTLQSFNDVNRLYNSIDNARAETRDAAQASTLAGYVTRDLIRTEADETRKLINSQYQDGLRDKLRYTENSLIEVRGDVRHWEHEGKRWERESFNSNFNALASSVNQNFNALNSQIQQVHQTASQKNVSFGTGAVTGGASSNNNAWFASELENPIIFGESTSLPFYEVLSPLIDEFENDDIDEVDGNNGSGGGDFSPNSPGYTGSINGNTINKSTVNADEIRRIYGLKSSKI